MTGPIGPIVAAMRQAWAATHTDDGAHAPDPREEPEPMTGGAPVDLVRAMPRHLRRVPWPGPGTTHCMTGEICARVHGLADEHLVTGVQAEDYRTPTAGRRFAQDELLLLAHQQIRWPDMTDPSVGWALAGLSTIADDAARERAFDELCTAVRGNDNPVIQAVLDLMTGGAA